MKNKSPTQAVAFSQLPVVWVCSRSAWLCKCGQWEVGAMAWASVWLSEGTQSSCLLPYTEPRNLYIPVLELTSALPWYLCGRQHTVQEIESLGYSAWLPWLNYMAMCHNFTMKILCGLKWGERTLSVFIPAAAGDQCRVFLEHLWGSTVQREKWAGVSCRPQCLRETTPA